MQAMMQAAMEMGFSTSEAELLVGQTFYGAVDLLDKTDYSCEEWIKRVCSRGGTTEAALDSFRNNELYADIISGARAALNRAIELGKE
jgi:pyrroline-5-carboxylate reductase